MRNTCAQRAAAHLISQHTSQPWRALHQRLLATHPPDTPLRLPGTTPARLAAALRHHGIPASALDEVTDHGVRADGRWHTMERWMRAWTCRVSPFPMHQRALVVPGLTLTG